MRGTAVRVVPVALAADRRFLRAQRGATAVEFALVFPVLFLLLYGIVVYAYVFLINESLTFVAQESAEAAVAVDPNDNDGYEAQVSARSRDTAQRLLAWLPGDQRERVLGTNGSKVAVVFSDDGAQRLVSIGLTFDLDGLFPSVSLLGLGEVPPIPDQLTSSATALLDPIDLLGAG